jgi:uncharacterized protein (UPF0333 family)
MGKDRGQISIEGILLLGFFILIFVGITFPSAIRVSGSSNEIAAIMEAQNNLNTISSAVGLVAAGQRGTVRTVTIVSKIEKWEINTNAPTDGINPTSKRPVLNYEIGIWGSDEDVPRQLYRIHSGANASWGAVTVLNMSGVSTGESASPGKRRCSRPVGGKGTWDVRIENAANTSSPYIVFNTTDHAADCTPSNTTINMYLVG